MGAVAITWLARSSVAWPIALIGLPGVVIALLGRNPFPHNFVSTLFLAWTLLALALFVVQNRDALPLPVLTSAPVTMTVALVVLMLVRLGASDAPQYGSYKLQLFVATAAVPLIAGIAIGSRRRDFGLWVVLEIAVAGIVALVLIDMMVKGARPSMGDQRFALSDESNPIQLGRAASDGLIVTTFVLMTGASARLRALAIVALPLLGVALIASGSRGPLLGLIIGLTVLLGLAARDAQTRKRLAFLPVGAAVAALLISQLVPGQTVGRSFSVILGGSDSNGRSALWSQAWDAFSSHPLLGLGTGSFAAVNPGKVYPHDIVLEAGAELGLLGVLLVGGIVVLGAFRLYAAWGRTAAPEKAAFALVLALFASASFNALVSSDLAGNGSVWLALGLGVGLASRRSPEGALAAAARSRRRRPAAAVPPPAERPARMRQLPTREPRRTVGAILQPAAGARVHGQVAVVAEAATTGWGAAAVTIELRALGGAWEPLPAQHEAPYELLLPLPDGRSAPVGVLRSQRLAESVSAALRDLGTELRIAPTARRPWQSGATWVATWDATELPQGPYELRAATLDIAGNRVVSEPVAVELTADVPAPAPAEVAAERLEERETALADVEQRLAAVEAAERELAAREQQLAFEEPERAAERGRLDAALAARQARIDAALEELEARRSALDKVAAVSREREQRLEAQERMLEAREASVADVEQRLAAAERELQGREQRLAAAEPELAAERERLDAALADVDARQAELAAREAELERLEPELAQRRTRIEALVEERESRLDRTVEERETPSVEPAAPALQLAPTPRPAAGARPLLLWELEDLVARERADDPLLQEERELTLFFLRDHVDTDGVLPERFHRLVYDVLGGLLEAR